MKKKILIVDDEERLVKMIAQVLSQRGYEVFKASNGQEALQIFFAYKPDLVLLDVVMPRMDGWQTCSRMRDVSNIPIIMLTGKRQSEEDIVRGLDYGADDYLLKPVGNNELLARVRGALRRAELPSADIEKQITYGDGFLVVDVTERKITVNGERVRLTPREYNLFILLVENAGRILTHKQILERVWGWEYTDDLDYVRIYISHLRQKIEPNSSLPKYIITEPGVGYCFQKTS
ncbi:MAG: response regulator transcription factor [Dehalococcoidales bacterium]|nr:response regulator transcription factor [Dehalococcoidales bacterium]